MESESIAWASPILWGKEVDYVTDAITSSWISGGPYIERFEEALARDLQVEHTLAVSNGTTALHLSFLGLDLKPGDEIIVPGFGFLAAANTAINLGLAPVFADVNMETWCISAKDVREKISSKTRAVVTIHTYGNISEIEECAKLAKEHNIYLIEDSAEALFSTASGKSAGNFGDVSTFSFHATKTVTTGEGGMVATNDSALADRMKLIRSHGLRREIHYWHEIPGHNFRLTNFQAAMGCAQLEFKKTIIEERGRVYRRYKNRIDDIPGLIIQKVPRECQPVIWTMGVRLDRSKISIRRDAVMNVLSDHGIETRPGFYTPWSMSNIYDAEVRLPAAEEVSQSVICLPLYPLLTNHQIDRICDTLIFAISV